ncbi:hypothetical protein Hanom_Chr07g00588811 [Helianthus anomalus]
MVGLRLGLGLGHWLTRGIGAPHHSNPRPWGMVGLGLGHEFGLAIESLPCHLLARPTPGFKPTPMGATPNPSPRGGDLGVLPQPTPKSPPHTPRPKIPIILCNFEHNCDFIF